MNWIDIASIVFVCVTMNHLGLIKAAEDAIGRGLPIINCPKCSTFWLTLTFLVTDVQDVTKTEVNKILAVSFLASYIALWLELLEAYIDQLYLWLYGKIITTDTDDTAASDADSGDSAGTVS